MRTSKKLAFFLHRRSGHGRDGKVTVRHRGAGARRLYRKVDFRRDKFQIPARVETLEYDPNRGADLALLSYADGEKRYILAPQGLKLGERVVAGEGVEVKIGNALPLREIPVGTLVHNLEIYPGRGGQFVRGAGTAATVIAPEEKGYVQVKMPSGEIRKILARCYATVGQLGNPERKNVKLGKAGRKRHLGIRPAVRGVAQHPGSHPHGGGEGRSGIGMAGPKTPWGRPALGRKTRRRHHTDKFIVLPRTKK
jgi:large subunit ribosomal protein L2